MSDPFEDYEHRKSQLENGYDSGWVSDPQYMRECERLRDDYRYAEYGDNQ